MAEASAEKFTTRFKTRIHLLEVAGREIQLLAPFDPDALLDDPSVEQRYKADNYMPYWPIIWPSGLMLAEMILTGRGPHNPPPNCPPLLPPGAEVLPDAQRPRCIDLGCGLGSTGIAAGLRGWHVTFTDYDPEAVEFAGHNALRNGLPPARVRTSHMDWRAPLEERFPWVLASDVLYERRLHVLLLGAIKSLLADDGVAWVSDPQRTSAEDFPLAAVEAGFKVTAVNLEGKNFAGGVQPGTLYVLIRV